MKVCHFVASVGLGRGDACVDLVNALAPEIDAALVAPRGARFIDVVDKRVGAFEYGSRNTRANPFLHRELYRLFRKINPDIVHTHFAKASEIFFILNKALGIRHVATKHNPRKGRIYNRLEHVIAVSKGVAESVRHDNVKVIYNGIHPVHLPDDTSVNNVFTIVAVGRLDKIKAFDRLVNECSKLEFDFNLVIVGDGTERVTLENLATDLKIKDKVTFLGFRRDVPQLMQKSDVVVVCSLSEGFSLVLIEAMFYSKMVISRRVGIAAEIFPEVLLIEHFDISKKIREVHDDFEKHSRCFLDLKNRYCSKFLLENSAKEHIDYYEKILSLK
jgi:glycosyltransferase involved in cell wall biosynthesis